MITENPNAITPQTAARWRDDGQHVTWNGHQIFIRTGGQDSAPPLLLLHGFPTSSLDWLPLWQELTARYRVLAFDFLGFGFSDKPKRHRYDLQEQVDLAAHLADTHFGADFHILAHDYGVSPGQELLARHGEGRLAHQMLSCAFLNGGLLPAQHRARPIQKLLAGPFGGLFVHLMNRERFGKSFSAVFGRDTQPSAVELDAYWAVISHKDGDRLQHKLLHYIADRRTHGPRWQAPLTNPPCPIALINGTQDPVSGGHLVDAIAALNPEVPAWRLDHLGHYPQTEGAADVMAAYAEFRGGL
ncbi:alpha/beta fold hydrolase [Sphingorhabdus sp. Alg231-15]|uniref:alpha/beta fold hydrolase n=1 Tax=Sphingorhabdus sp. Alg231-15 TaxID=1922222 RepID=UPI000D54FD32